MISSQACDGYDWDNELGVAMVVGAGQLGLAVEEGLVLVDQVGVGG